MVVISATSKACFVFPWWKCSVRRKNGDTTAVTRIGWLQLRHPRVNIRLCARSSCVPWRDIILWGFKRFFNGNIHTESRRLVLLYYYPKRKLMLCFNKAGTEVCSASLYVCRPVLSCALTELGHERTHLPCCVQIGTFNLPIRNVKMWESLDGLLCVCVCACARACMWLDLEVND
jgi:hypothetical protein